GLILAILLIVGALAYAYFEFVINYLSDWVAKTNLETNVTDNDFVTARARSLLFFFIMSYLITAILYYFGTADGRHTRFFSIGALMTSLLFLLTSYLFGIYVEKFARYNELYGTLGALLILMVFIWLNSNILLLGFELNASLRSLKKQYRETGLDKF
ncbi:MAG: YihY/virulence factor BrkB family protein, partial [Flavobacteriaceae bacterium]